MSRRIGAYATGSAQDRAYLAILAARHRGDGCEGLGKDEW
jgi:hypothetical protein